MGKIVKFCSSCDEGFAEKFTFCPDCGQPLQAFEMKPVAKDAPPAETVVVAAPVAAESVDLLEIPVAEAASNAEFEPVEEPVLETAPIPAMTEPVEEPVIETAPPAAEIEQIEEPVVEAAQATAKVEHIDEPVIEAAPSSAETELEEELTAEVATSKAAAVSTSLFIHSKPIDVDRKPISFEAEHDAYAAEGGFYITVLEEKNVKQRNRLLLGSTLFMVSLAIVMTIWSLFNAPLSVYAIGEDGSLASLIDELPMTVEEEQQQKRDKDAGGGGGGGRKEEETTQGDLANQTKNPERAPQAIPRLENPLQLPPASTQGNRTYEQKFDRFGDPSGRFTNWNNGTGSGGGQGSGTGTGQGSGRGTGNGSGDGSGSGSGIGNGNGSGTGDGDGGGPPPPPVGVTQPWKLISKPRPGYTDAARQANIQGTVVLKVVFLASGQVGSISAIKGLPNGLTEQAIAAARNIKFEPAKTNGVPRAVSKTIEYTFSIY